MFNDLNNPSAANQPAVDDIFAETDKPASSGTNDIEMRRVGLTSSGVNLPPVSSQEAAASSKGTLKIIIIVILALAILGGAYFAYSQFLKKEEPVLPTPKTENNQVKPAVNNQTEAATETPQFVNEIPGMETSTEGLAPTEVASSSEGVVSDQPEAELLVDSDSDGLTDREEMIAGTNPNVIDTDNDGLSDYEEVKIYLSNPLNIDTDGDTYSDGVEVKGGYNPNGTGKLPGNELK